MLRARHVQSDTIEVLLVRTMAPEQRARLVREGKRKPIVRPTYGQMLNREKERRGWALRAAELVRRHYEGPILNRRKLRKLANPSSPTLALADTGLDDETGTSISMYALIGARRQRSRCVEW